MPSLLSSVCWLVSDDRVSVDATPASELVIKWCVLTLSLLAVLSLAVIQQILFPLATTVRLPLLD